MPADAARSRLPRRDPRSRGLDLCDRRDAAASWFDLDNSRPLGSERFFERLFALCKSSPTGASLDDRTLRVLLADTVDVVVPLQEDHGAFSIAGVWFIGDALRRGESAVTLLQEGYVPIRIPLAVRLGDRHGDNLRRLHLPGLIYPAGLTGLFRAVPQPFWAWWLFLFEPAATGIRSSGS